MRRLLLALVLAAIAAPLRAQTTDFVALLYENSPPAPMRFGMAFVRVTDNPAPGGDVLVVRGQFRGLQSAYTASRIRRGADQPVVQNLTAGVAPNGRFGGWGATENTFGIADDVTAALLAGTAVVEVATANTPAGELRGTLVPLGVVVDGRVDEAAYRTIATKQNANAGFGPAIDATSTRAVLDPATGVAVIAVTGRLNTASNDGIALWTGAVGVGAPAGTPLGGTPSAGHYLGATEHPTFKADVPVLLAFALNPGGGTQSVFLDVVQYMGDGSTRLADYLGAAAQDGGVAIGPPDPTANDGTSAPPLSDVAFAFRNDGAATSGFEIVVPFDNLGFPVSVARASAAAVGGRAISAGAFVVSATAFFSDVTVPGTVAGGNLGFDPDFRSVPGGPFSASGGGFTALAPGPGSDAVLRLAGPNPTGTRARLVLALDAARSVRVDVLDALGRTVAVLHDGPARAGETTLDVDAAALPPGVYAVRVAGDGVRAVQRLTVAR